MSSSLVLFLVSACGGSEPPSSSIDVAWMGADTVISTESAIIGRSIDLAGTEDGSLLVLDVLNAQIHFVEANGTFDGSIGREGSGPGEMRRPSSFFVEGDTIWVADQRNGRLQGLNRAGEMLATYPLPPEAVSSRVTLGAGGRVLATGWGGDSTLVRLFDREGRPAGEFGEALETPPEFLDMVAIRREITEGGIPGFFRNQTIPAFSQGGGIWVGLQGVGEVRRYDSIGGLSLQVPLWEEEFEGIRETFFRRNSEEMEVPGFYSLRYFADAMEVGSELWILLNRGEEDEGVILVVSLQGELVRRVKLPDVLGPGQFWPDLERNRLYLGIPSVSAVVSVAMGNGA